MPCLHFLTHWSQGGWWSWCLFANYARLAHRWTPWRSVLYCFSSRLFGSALHWLEVIQNDAFDRTLWHPITDRLKAIGLDSLELRRLHHDLVSCTYKVLFGKLEMDHADMVLIRPQSATRAMHGNCSLSSVVQMCSIFFFCERVVVPWNWLNISIENLRSITSFQRLIKGSDLSAFLHYF